MLLDTKTKKTLKLAFYGLFTAYGIRYHIQPENSYIRQFAPFLASLCYPIAETMKAATDGRTMPI